MLFLFRSASKVEKRIHSKFFRKFWEEPGYKRTDLHYCIGGIDVKLTKHPYHLYALLFPTNTGHDTDKEISLESDRLT